ncbi:hypothetical protein F4776DRAFT_663935 [Hypoxylon sp. NC0597]|nr:hypothetical protein F4776DRAFT_663935 [Hypoxylon sp. NC0597]
MLFREGLETIRSRLKELPREDNFRPPSTSISRRCSSSQARNVSDDAPSNVGLEDPFVGLEGFPDFDGFLGAFNVLDYWEGDGPGGAVEDATSDVYPEVAGGEIREESEPEWLGVPMPGQFPMSNWLSDKLNISHGDTEPIMTSDLPMEPQIAHFDHCHLNPDWKVSPDSGPSSSLNFNDPRLVWPSLVHLPRDFTSMR